MVGGLVGLNAGTVTASFATGIPTARGQGSAIGGLVGQSSGPIMNCYATGRVRNVVQRVGASTLSDLGGLVGKASAPITASYFSGLIDDETDPEDSRGGFVGFDGSGGMKRDYWDTETSGIASPSAGAGKPANDPGITGQTTAQLSAKLSVGFGSAIWAVNPNINGGLPYLIHNPPPQ